MTCLVLSELFWQIYYCLSTNKKLLISWQFSGPYGITKHGSGWRKDVVNQCLEFDSDPVCAGEHVGVLMTLCNLTVLIVGLSHLVHVGWYVVGTMCFFMNTLVYVTDVWVKGWGLGEFNGCIKKKKKKIRAEQHLKFLFMMNIAICSVLILFLIDNLAQLFQSALGLCVYICTWVCM